MRSTLDELTTELTELKALVASIAPVNKALSGHQDSLVQQYVSIRRRFDYAAFAVALYASFEKFIENLVIAYIRLESRRVQYAALPQKLMEKHLSGSAEILWRGRLGEGRYAGLSELGVVKNLFECLSGASPYSLNEAVVVSHNSNLRAGEIDAVCGAMGIENVCDRVRRADALVQWYCAAKGLDAPPQDGVSRAVIEERLNDIVERRNQVAHRGGNPIDLLGVDAMNDAIGFVEGFSNSFFSLAVASYLHGHHATTGIQLHQREGDGPYKNGTVVVVEKPGHEVVVGQPVFVTIGNTGARWGRIQSIKIDDADVQTVDAGAAAPNGIGLGLDFKCPKGATLVALVCEDDVVWSPPSLVVAPTA